MYVVIIVGARCAGAPLAMLLARQGARILLVDRAVSKRHPARPLHSPARPATSARLGVLGPIAARAPAVVSAVVDLGDFPPRARDLIENGVALGYGPRRTTLDKMPRSSIPGISSA